MGKDKDYRVEERKSKAFIDPGSSGRSAEEETPAASHLRKLDAMFASGTAADVTATVGDDQAARLAAIDAKFAGYDNAVAPGDTNRSEAVLDSGMSARPLAEIDAQFAGSDNAAKVGWGPSDDPQFNESIEAGGAGLRPSMADDEAYGERGAFVDDGDKGGLRPSVSSDEVYRGDGNVEITE